MSNLAPAETFVSIKTPVETTGKQGGMSKSELQCGSWARQVEPCEFSDSYFWMTTCCPCISLAQIEAYMGLCSYKKALWVNGAMFTTLALCILATILWFITWTNDRCNWTFTAFILIFVVQLFFVVKRLAAARAEVRERFHIPGDQKEDRRVAWLHTCAAIRQIGYHLHLENCKFGAPSSLPAYEA